MSIICIRSCLADGAAINKLREIVHNVTTHCQHKNIAGRYILAYHGNRLVGVADTCGEEQTCIMPSHMSLDIQKALNAELNKISA